MSSNTKTNYNKQVMINVNNNKRCLFIETIHRNNETLQWYWIRRVIVEKENGKTISFLPTCGKGNPPKKFPSLMGEGKLKLLFSRSEKWKENLFPFHKKSLILLILVGKNSFFSDFFSCKKGRENWKKKSSREMRDAGSRIPSLSSAITLWIRVSSIVRLFVKNEIIQRFRKTISKEFVCYSSNMTIDDNTLAIDLN